MRALVILASFAITVAAGAVDWEYETRADALFCGSAQAVMDGLTLIGKGQSAMVSSLDCRTLRAGVKFVPMEHGRYGTIRGALEGRIGYISAFYLFDKTNAKRVTSSSDVRF